MRIFWASLFMLVPILGVLTFVLAAMGAGSWLPTNLSVIGQDIDHLFYVILYVTAFFFVVTEVLLAYAMFTGKAKADGKGEFIHGSHKLEVIWTAVTSAILLFVAFYQIPAWQEAKFRSHMPRQDHAFKEDGEGGDLAMVKGIIAAQPGNSKGAQDAGIKDANAIVTGTQFLWQVRYPMWDSKTNRPVKLDPRKPDLLQSFEPINELRIPVGEKVLIHLRSADVLHSFWLPSYRVKQDALPGHIIPVWFETLPDAKPGPSEWVCAELCGWGHYRMRGKVILMAKDDYYNWLKEHSGAK